MQLMRMQSQVLSTALTAWQERVQQKMSWREVQWLQIYLTCVDVAEELKCGITCISQY